MTPGLMFVLESFRRHMDNGRWLFQLGMEAAGYSSIGGGLPPPGSHGLDVGWAIESWRPQVAIMWPRYEWDPAQWGGPEVTAAHCFTNIAPLVARSDVLRVAVFHDAGSDRARQRLWHEEFQPHVWLTWYHPQSVAAVAPHVPRERMVRTYHILDPVAAPPIVPRQGVACVTGAASPNVYPLRTRAIQAAKAGELGPGVHALKHPGYRQDGSHSNSFLHTLAGYRVAICTASAYRFALRKLFEATAAGCIVVTDLPAYDGLPAIEGNLIRVSPDIPTAELREVVQAAAAGWDLARQSAYALAAVNRYHHFAETARLAKELAAWHARLMAGNCPWAQGGFG